MKAKKYDIKQYRQYSLQCYIIESEYLHTLTEWEQDFFKSVVKKIGFLSDKQTLILDKICRKIFSDH